jgi:hypothetical protein
MIMIWPAIVVFFAASLWFSNSLRWTGRRRIAAVYSAATAFAGGLTVLGWLGDCAPGEIDGQCGMSTAFMTLIGLLGAFIIVALGHWLPALQGASRARDG